MERFLGGNPLAVVLKLTLASVVAGILLSQMGYDLYDFLDLLHDIGASLRIFWRDWSPNIIGWFALGAAVVVPVWAFVRLIKFLGGKKGGSK